MIARLCDALGLIGTPDYCAQRLLEMASAGVTKLYIMPLQTFVPPRQEIEAFREVILPRLRQGGG